VARARDVSRGALGPRHAAAILAMSAAVIASPRGVPAQPGSQRPGGRTQPEARVDFIDSRAQAAHIGLGVGVAAGTYVRLGVIGAVGRAWTDDRSRLAGRVDGLVRFTVDPLREARWAPYASAGVGGLFDERDRWRAVLIGALGVEGPSLGRLAPAVEVGFGGGARVGVALRRAYPGRR
jgi:hypothetical protein